jgi:23S rRNA (adenine2503-C2)-methyltransferase
MTQEPRHDRSQPIRIYDLDLPALEDLLEAWGEPSYRAAQIWEWLYVHLVDSFSQMTNLPKSLRRKLSEESTLDLLETVETTRSPDRRTRKDLLRLTDGETIEAVLMHYQTRRTACLSTQVGCALGCPFCATGQMGLRRNLTSGEIVAQAVHFARPLQDEDNPLTNVVLMGMGEPLANYDSSLAAIHRLNHPDGFRLGQRHITLSTVGLVPMIGRLAQEDLQITLAISLHAATDELRNQLVPINRRYGLEALFKACAAYFEKTGRRISFEWALIQGVNDTPEQAHALADRVHESLPGTLIHVNLIPLNPSPEYAGGAAGTDAVHAFTAILEARSIPYTIRVRRGAAIQAGCGQLRQRHQRR